jgi:hypothetical protein
MRSFAHHKEQDEKGDLENLNTLVGNTCSPLCKVETRSY